MKTCEDLSREKVKESNEMHGNTQTTVVLTEMYIALAQALDEKLQAMEARISAVEKRRETCLDPEACAAGKPHMHRIDD